MFDPGFWGLLINPYYFSRRELARHVKEMGRHITGRTLDIGCGSKPYEKFCNSTAYIGLELPPGKGETHKYADCYFDGYTLPFNDSTFDSIMLNQVLEHVFRPDMFLNEVNRVLKPCGKLLVTVPFVWDEHETPHDYARYTSFGLVSLLGRHGFDILDHRKTNSNIRLICQLFSNYLYKTVKTPYASVNLMIRLVLIAPVNITGVILGMLTPANDDLFLDNIILATRG